MTPTMMIWQSPKGDMNGEEVQRGMDYYQTKYGHHPNLVWLHHASPLEVAAKMLKVKFVASNCCMIGVE